MITLRHLFRRSTAVVAAFALLFAGLLAGGGTAGATFPGSNGPLYVSGLLWDLVDPVTGSRVAGAFPRQGDPYRFSADGASLVNVQTDFDADTSTIMITTNKGETRKVITRPGYLDGAGFSPTGTSIVTSGAVGGDYRTFVVGADGSGWHEVGNHPMGAADPDWNPRSNRIAYIQGVDVFTINADGSGKSQWTDECIYADDESFCEIKQDPGQDYSGPRWSPDGASVLVWVLESQIGGDDSYFIGILRAGAKRAVPLVHVAADAGGVVTVPRYVWSPDGKSVAFTRDAATGGTETAIKDLATGSVRTVTASRVLDWQPCPGGVCAPWGTLKPTTTTLTYSAGGTCGPSGCVTTGIRAMGAVAPPLPGLTVNVRLDAWRVGGWRKVALKTPTLNASSRFTASFGKPRGSKCRLTAIFHGNAEYASSSATRIFAC